MDFNQLHFLAESSIDFIRRTFAPTVFIDEESAEPTMRPELRQQIADHVALINKVAPVKQYFIKGSILTKQYTDKADIDVFVRVRPTGVSTMEEDMEKVWSKIDGVYAKNTTHPLQYYITDAKYDLKNTEAAYDVKNNTWLSRAVEKEIDELKYANALKNKLNRLDVMTGELRRDVIDHELLDSIPHDQVDNIAKKTNDKLKEVEYDIKALIKSYKEIAGARKEAFAQEMTPEQISEYGRKTHLPGNVIFKFVERYHYLEFLRRLRDILGDDKQLSKDEYEKMVKAEPMLRGVAEDVDQVQIFSDPVDKKKPDAKDRFRDTGVARARHLKHGFTGLDRKTGQNLIPDIHKTDPTDNTKIEILRDKPAGRFVLTQADVNEISNIYNLVGLNGNVRKDDPMYIKKTGMYVYFDPSLSRFCLEK